MTHRRRIQFETNIPPPKRRTRHRQWIDEFFKLKVGQSFKVWGFAGKAMSASLSYHKKRGNLEGREFTTRQIEEGVWRCWRLK